MVSAGDVVRVICGRFAESELLRVMTYSRR